MARCPPFSPHTRGCSFLVFGVMVKFHLFPAYAGVILASPPRLHHNPSFPRICGGAGGRGYSDHAPACILRKNAQTKSRQCRGKEEESDTACCIGTPEHCGLVRRDLVVCPPFWLLPRIETGDSFFMGLLCAAAAAAPAGKCACMGICGENLSEVMGDVRSVLPECTLIMPDNRGNSLW